MDSIKRKRPISTLQFIAIGFFILIVIGSILLILPISSKEGVFTDPLTAVFTTTSALCVTGLIVVDTASYWSIFGKIVIITLIQIGGLGFISIGVIISIILRKKIGLGMRGLMVTSINALELGGIVKLVRCILLGTLLFEGLGALILAIRFSMIFGIKKGIVYGIFHSVSAFCNAGFDLMGTQYEQYCSFTYLKGDTIINIVIMFLIVVGGIGFIVWSDILKNKFNLRKYKLHSKIVLLMTVILIFIPALLFFILEYNDLFKDFTLKDKILAALFSSVTARTAGFNTVDVAALSSASKFLTVILMYIGGGSGSTAGGIKVVTIFVLFVYIRSNIKNTYTVNAFGRRLSDEVIKTAAAIATVNLCLIITSTFIILSVEGLDLIDVLFETTSAMSTVGITTGITRDLGIVSRIILIILMYLGRVGSLSFALAFTQNKKVAKVSLPIERISVG